MDPEELLAHIDFVRALARSLVQDVHTAADIEQQTWLATLEHPPRDRKSLRSWLSRVALNFARRMYWADKKRRRHESAYQDNGSITSPDQIVEREELRRRLIDMVLDLNDPYRKAIILRYCDGLKPREIADHLDIPIETVWTHLKRGLAKLRQKLDARYGGDQKQWLTAMAPIAGLNVGISSAGIAGGSSLAAIPATLGGMIMSTNMKLGVTALLMLLVTSTLFYAILWEEDADPSLEKESIQPSIIPDTFEETHVITEPTESQDKGKEKENAETAIFEENNAAEIRRNETGMEIFESAEKLPFNMALVPEGEVLMGMKPDAAYNLIQNQKSLLDIFSRCTPRIKARTENDIYCDIHEVTNAQWKLYLDSTGQEPSQVLVDNSWKKQPTYPVGEQNLPVRNISLEEVRKFARWCGKRIPTETEWHRAAAGDDGRIYAWGNEWDETKCTTRDNSLMPVGSYEDGKSPFGIHDMTGSVWEWTISLFEAFKGYSPLEVRYGQRTVESAPRFNISQYVTKGGCYYLGEIPNRLEVREPALPTDNLSSLGFRCVKDAKPGSSMFSYTLQDIADSGLDAKAFDPEDMFFIENTLWSNTIPPLIRGYDFMVICPRNALPLTGEEFLKESKERSIPIGFLSLSKPLKRPPLPQGSYVIAYQYKDVNESEQNDDAKEMTEKQLVFLQNFKIGRDESIEAESIAREATKNPVRLIYYPASQDLKIFMSVPLSDGFFMRLNFRLQIRNFPF